MTSAAALGAFAFVSVALVGSSSQVDTAPHVVEPRLSLEEARRFDDFPLVYAGSEIDGLPLTTVLRRSGEADFVSFVYGDCPARDDEGCAPPAEIQVWPACRRNLALYAGSNVASAAVRPPHERATIRGLPGAIFDGGSRIELQTGTTTVVVFADGRDRARRVVRALRRLAESVPQHVELPPPDPGAVEGLLTC